MISGKASLALARVALLSSGVFAVWSAFQLVWSMLGASSATQLSTTLSLPASHSAADQAPQLPLSAYNLFGQIGQSAGAAPAAPETALNVTLRGIVGAKNPEDGIAIIADPNGDEEPYTVGQSVAETGAVLEAVYADRVILRIAGRQETLTWPKLAAVTLGRAPPRAAMLPQPAIAAPPALPAPLPGEAAPFINPNMNMTPFEAVREAAIKDPNAFMKQVQVIPQWQDGNLSGVKLSFGANAAVAEQAGLRATDVVVAVNGVRIDSIDQGLKVAESLRSANRLSVVVRRDGREVPLPAIELQ